MKNTNILTNNKKQGKDIGILQINYTILYNNPFIQ